MDNTQHDALFIPSPAFGGGWVIPQSDQALSLMESMFGGPPSFQSPVDRVGYVVEPYQVEDLAHYARAHGLTIQLEV